MKKIFSMNKDWLFKKEDQLVQTKTDDYFSMFDEDTKTGIAAGARSNSLYDKDWEAVDLPHDWCVAELPQEKYQWIHGYKPQETVWYRKHFKLSKEYENKKIFVKFEAIAIKSEIYFNNVLMAKSESGYTPILIDLTDFFNFNTDNVLCVRASNQVKEGWWYEGGGIYGDVSLVICDETHFENDGIFVNAQDIGNTWEVSVKAEIEGETENCELEISLGDFSKKVKAESHTEFTFNFDNPRIWGVKSPNLYKVSVKLLKDNEIIDEEGFDFGFRKIEFDSEKGFFLNGENIKLKGVCLHHDHTAVGVAVPYEIHKFRLQKLKDMGCNAIRTSHNPQLKSFYKACDELGFLVMNEVRHFSSSAYVLDELKTFIKRDRNHPCVIMWSMFNEEPLQSSKVGEKIARSMKKIIDEFDGTRKVTGGMNGPLEMSGVINVVDLMGFNYLQYGYDEFHKMFPGIPIFGSETGSYMSTRGEYTTDRAASHVSACGEVLNENLYFWSATPENTWRYIEERPFVMGGFYWTGIDYRGEAGPFDWPGITATFGAMDLCCFPKDNFYRHKVLWDDNYNIFISPHWNFNDGEKVKVICYSNCDEIELILNGRSVTSYKHDKFAPKFTELTFEAGTLKAVGRANGEIVCETEIKTPIKPYHIELETFENIVNAYAKDINGTIVNDFAESVTFEVSGNGKIVGTGNGDNANQNLETSNVVPMFHGCCQAVVRAYEDVKVTVCCGDMKSEAIIKSSEEKADFIPSEESKIYINNWRMSDVHSTYPEKENIHNDMFTWIPTTIGENTKNLMMSGKMGYATIAGKFTSKVDTMKIVLEDVRGNFEVYLQGTKLYASKGFEKKYLELEAKYPDNTDTVSLALVFKISGEDDCGIYGSVYFS